MQALGVGIWLLGMIMTSDVAMEAIKMEPVAVMERMKQWTGFSERNRSIFKGYKANYKETLARLDTSTISTTLFTLPSINTNEG